MTLAIKKITVFGDSHSALFFETPFYAGRLRLKWPLRYRVIGEPIPAASVAGFRPGDSKMMVKDKILASLPESERMILAFGQVDLELGYYYRLAVKGEIITPQSYVEWLLGIYADFVGRLNVSASCQVALKGVNATALSPRPFAARYVSRIVMEGTKMGPDEADRLVEPYLLSEDSQNAMHFQFNRGLADFAGKMGWRYFDLIAQTCSGAIPGISSEPPRLADEFRTGRFDHHLADTVMVRRLHYEVAGRIFDLI